jgi:hypothetical protein
MNPRTSRETVTFVGPFSLRGIDGVQPAGTYTVETDEELIESQSFLAYRRVATLMFLPSRPGGTELGQIATIDPVELRAVKARDAVGGAALPEAAHPPRGSKRDS